MTRFDPWLARWGLIPDGPVRDTPASRLLPVRCLDRPAMLKVTRSDEERAGYALMVWWHGEGAARVLACEGDALLMARATGRRSLLHMSRTGEDGAATAALCAVLARLHRPRAGAPPLIPLETWFADLWRFAADPRLARGTVIARQALAAQRERLPLHGDLHHGNVLDFGEEGWLAIDPKGIEGDRAFDHVRLFTNPDLADPRHAVALMPGVFETRLRIVARDAGIDRPRLLRWIVAGAALSAAWLLEDGADATLTLAVMSRALEELDGG
ncbi:aminoglycoside phosphotransferase family protein [Haematobacter missouriensis]|uniref:APH(6) family putative aminoglycoside O-phosphotransferase n=1 Tax=Haematobacter missouriensis TaxID=366616 RepID=A0A212AUG0_9RHOB|nr:APH(6) family putative aminoglycoside O-phosphotransferase [Haematobacter missouriensis]OWJ85075.1 APH(6) family putative aminoglycoside O-phosphotransferase [Haematobacter missouriensis]